MYTFNRSIREAEASDLSEFKASLVYCEFLDSQTTQRNHFKNTNPTKSSKPRITISFSTGFSAISNGKNVILFKIKESQIIDDVNFLVFFFGSARTQSLDSLRILLFISGWPELLI